MSKKNKKTSEYANVKVLLLEGFSRQTHPMLMALKKLGCYVATYNASKLDMGYASKYPDKKILGFWDREDEDKSYEALLEVLKNEKYDVVIPMTDFSAFMLSRHKEELLEYTKPAVNDWDVFMMAGDKVNTMIACMDNDIPCPKTLREVKTIEDVLNSELQFPLVVKPKTGYGSIGFRKVDNEEELQSALSTEFSLQGNLIVQEYIPQTDIQYKCELFVDADGEVKSAVVFNKTRWYPIDGGSSCCNETVSRPDIVESCKKLLKVIDWRGYADVDLIQDPRDGLAKVMEINPRITGSVKICFKAGVDFAKQIIDFETGRSVDDFQEYKIGYRLRYMHTDLLWFFKSPNRFKSKPSWFSWKNTCDQIWAWSDPWPWFTYTIQGLKRLKKEGKKRSRK